MKTIVLVSNEEFPNADSLRWVETSKFLKIKSSIDAEKIKEKCQQRGEVCEVFKFKK